MIDIGNGFYVATAPVDIPPSPGLACHILGHPIYNDAALACKAGGQMLLQRYRGRLLILQVEWNASQ